MRRARSRMFGKVFTRVLLLNMDDNMEGDAWSRRSSSNDEGKFREAMGMACSFLRNDIFFS